MTKKMSASKLRENIYSILDEILESGVPVEIQRKGATLKIIPEQKRSKLARLKKHNSIVGDPESLVHLDWSSDWSGDT